MKLNLGRRLKPSLGRGGRPLRIAYGRIFHEANAHSPLLTTRADFERMHHLAGDELAAVTGLRGSELAGYLAHAELTGFAQAARLAGDVETVPLVSSLAVPSGPLTRDCFDWLVDGMVDAIAAAGPLDGVYLALHGSMQVDGLQGAPEALLLARVRELVGDQVKIAVSYDLHANLTRGIVEPVDVLIAYRTNPHWDLAPTGFRAGNRLIRTLRGQCQPVHAWRKLPMVLGGGTTINFLSPMRKVFATMKRMERDPRVLSVSLFMVHPYTTAEELGWAVHVSTDDDPALAAQLAEELADLAWSRRDVEIPPMRTVDQALDEVAERPWPRLGPVSLVDIDDIVGAGAPGGNTQIAGALIANDRGLRAYVPVHDPALVDELWDQPVGASCSATLRGTPGYDQQSFRFQATVGHKATTDFGRTLRLDLGSVHLAICERSPLPIHPKFWREIGLSPRDADVIVQKNFFHYRIFYAAISFAHIPTVSAGATSLERVRNGPYRVPTHPATRLEDWRPYEAELRGASHGFRAPAV